MANREKELKTLQEMINDVLVQTAKAIRASRKDSARTGQGSLNTRSKIDVSINTFHRALDELEIEITDAKAVLRRDLDALRGKKAAAQPARAAAPPAPMAPDVQVSRVPSPVMARTQPPVPRATSTLGPKDSKPAPAAPFPDMGIGEQGMSTEMEASKPLTIDLTAEPSKPASPMANAKPAPNTKPTAATIPQAQPPVPVQQTVRQAPPPAPMSIDVSGAPSTAASTTAPAATTAELAFTDMQFSLAPLGDSASQEAHVDLTQLTSTNIGDATMLSLDNVGYTVAPTSSSAPAAAIAAPVSKPAVATMAPDPVSQAPPVKQPTAPVPEVTPKPATTNADDVYNLGEDTMDMDLGLGTGTGDNSFDDLFSDLGNMDDPMSATDLDDPFFHI